MLNYDKKKMSKPPDFENNLIVISIIFCYVWIHSFSHRSNEITVI